MALITCKRCQQEFSAEAVRCPQCGTSTPISKKLLCTFFGAVALVVFSSVLPAAPVNPPPSKSVVRIGDENAHGLLKPEMIVRFTQGTLACLSKDNLQEATEHAIAGERTKLEAMMFQNGGSCVMLSPSQRVKIISVEYNNPDMPDLGLVEIVGKGITAAQGAWAFSIGAEPVSSN